MAKLKQRGVSRHVINPPKTSHAPFTASHTKLNAKIKKKKKKKKNTNAGQKKCRRKKRKKKKARGRVLIQGKGCVVPQPRCPSQSCPSLAPNF